MNWGNARKDTEQRSDRVHGRRVHHLSIPVTFSEDPDEYTIRADLPGYTRRNLDVTVHGRRVQIVASDDHDHGDRRERIIAFPDHIDTQHVTAEYLDDVLTITAPKWRPTPQYRPARDKRHESIGQRGVERETSAPERESTRTEQEGAAEPNDRAAESEPVEERETRLSRPGEDEDDEVRAYEERADWKLERQRDLQRDKSGRQYRRS